MQYRVRRGGPWQALLPGVYLTVSGTPSHRQKEMAALLYAGPGSLITGPVALLHHSIRGGPSLDVIDVLVPAERQRLNAGFARLHRTARMPARISSSGPVRLALVPRAVADTARQLTSLRDVRAVVADAVQLGRCTIAELADELRNGPIKGSAMFRSVLAEVADGIRSTAEGDLRDLIRAARLPMPLFNPSLYKGDTFLAKPDAWWPDAGVAAEVDSRAFHLSPEDWDRTRRRHTLMAAVGISPAPLLPPRHPYRPSHGNKAHQRRLGKRPHPPPSPHPYRPVFPTESMNVTLYPKRVNRMSHSLVLRHSTPAHTGPVCVECTALGGGGGGAGAGPGGRAPGPGRGGGPGGAKGPTPAPGRGSSLLRLAGGPRSRSTARGSA